MQGKTLFDIDSNENKQRELLVNEYLQKLRLSLNKQLSLLLKLKADKKFNDNQNSIIKTLLKSSKYIKSMSTCLSENFSNKYAKLNKTLFNFDCLIKECIEEFKTIANNKNIDIIYQPTNFIIYADKNQIKRVLINFINIALSYADEKTNLHITQSKKKNFFIFKIKTYHNYIKNSLLYRFYTKSIEKIEDYYISLYSARQIANAHNGKICITSKGNETTLLFTIPMMKI